MAQGVHKITEQFEQELCKYTGAPYCVAVDNCSNALFLALYYELQIKSTFWDCEEGSKPIIQIPSHTYPSVPCEIIHAGGKVEFDSNYAFGFNEKTISGHYCLRPTKVYDSSLCFTDAMYIPKSHMCLSFTGPYKHLKLGKGGAILTDDADAMLWFKRARFSGRSECSYFEDDFDAHTNDGTVLGFICPVVGWNFYMMPEIAARGLLLLQQFYDADGRPKSNPDLCLRYPDLSKFKVFQQ